MTTIMLNYVAIEFTSYMVQSGPFFVPGMANAMSETIAQQAQLPRLVEALAVQQQLFSGAGVCRRRDLPDAANAPGL